MKKALIIISLSLVALLISTIYLNQIDREDFSTKNKIKPTTPSSLTQLIDQKKVSPINCNKCGRAEIISVRGKIFMAFSNADLGGRFQLVELNDDLSYKSKIFNIFSDAITDNIEYSSIDIRLASDGVNLWYAFESLPQKTRYDKQICDRHLGIAKYDISGSTPILLRHKQDIVSNGCPSALQFDKLDPNTIPQVPESVDDPTPFFHNEKYIVLTRGTRKQIEHIRIFDSNFNKIEDFNLDLSSVIGNKVLSQNTLIDIDNQIYLIGGLTDGSPKNGKSDIYAIPLSSDLRSVNGKIIPLLTDPNTYYMKTTMAKYINNKLYINYVIAGDGQLQHIGVFDIKNNFTSLAQLQFQEETSKSNHSCFEIIGNKLITLYPKDSGKKSGQSILADIYKINTN